MALIVALILAAGVHPLSADQSSESTLLWTTFPYPPGVSTQFRTNRNLFLAPVMDPEAVARAALQDEKRIIQFTEEQFLRLDGQICTTLPELRKSVQDGFNLLNRANEILETNVKSVVSEHSRERQLYFKLRKERDAALQNAWFRFLDWQSSKCTDEQSFFGDPVQDRKNEVDVALGEINRKTLAMRLAWFRFLSRLDLETRQKILLP